MSDTEKINLGDAIFSSIDDNPYLNELYDNILYNYSLQKFELTSSRPSREINISAALRFADLLSKSTHPEKKDKHKMWAQEIVVLLHELYPHDEDVGLVAGSVLYYTGNHQGQKMIKSNYQALSALEKVFTEFQSHYLEIPAEPDLHFLGAQKNVYDHLNDQFFSYSGPTSMGKSFIMRMFVKKQMQDGNNLNFALIVPTKALINEVSSRIIRDLQSLLSERNYKVVTSPGALALQEEHNFIFVLTPERFLYLLIGNKNINIDYLFIDEAHKISSRDSRSPFYYKVVDMLSNRSCEPHIIFASPNIPNPEVYLKIIPDVCGAERQKLATTFAPVSQVKYLINFQNGLIQVYNSYLKELMTVGEIDTNMTFGQLVSQIGNRSQNIVYCGSIAKAVEQAVEYANNEQERNEKELLTLSKDIANEVHGDYYLAKIITKGVAYHIGYLPAAIRMRIEKAFSDGLIHTIFCTSTLLEGVNLPADNLFVTSYKNGGHKMDVVDFRNLIGRVGRIEYNLYGNVYLVRLPDEKRFKTETYVELLKADVPEQSLSVVEGLSDEQKQIIVDSLIAGDLELNTTIKIKDDDYNMMRKFTMILLRDITKGNNSFVRRAFAPFLQGNTESRIKSAFCKSPNEPDDDINVSVDQSNRLIAAIAGGLKYPHMGVDGYVDYSELMNFLERLCYIFKWEKYEKDSLGFRGKNGELGKLRWYGVILSQWVKGEGLKFIMDEAIKKRKEPKYRKLYYNYQPLEYEDSPFHRNIVISQTLEAIERIILFSISNYFLKFSDAYKKYHKIEGDMPNDWYEYVEYGTTNPLSIMFQRHGFSRETATYIRKKRNFYVVYINDEPKLRRSILNCGNESVINEALDIMYNAPELFLD